MEDMVDTSTGDWWDGLRPLCPPFVKLSGGRREKLGARAENATRRYQALPIFASVEGRRGRIRGSSEEMLLDLGRNWGQSTGTSHPTPNFPMGAAFSREIAQRGLADIWPAQTRSHPD
jgi:hypothetical protein